MNPRSEQMPDREPTPHGIRPPEEGLSGQPAEGARGPARFRAKPGKPSRGPSTNFSALTAGNGLLTVDRRGCLEFPLCRRLDS
jgi:hypothetical protein